MNKLPFEIVNTILEYTDGEEANTILNILDKKKYYSDEYDIKDYYDVKYNHNTEYNKRKKNNKIILFNDHWNTQKKYNNNILFADYCNTQQKKYKCSYCGHNTFDTMCIHIEDITRRMENNNNGYTAYCKMDNFATLK